MIFFFKRSLFGLLYKEWNKVVMRMDIRDYLRGVQGSNKKDLCLESGEGNRSAGRTNRYLGCEVWKK